MNYRQSEGFVGRRIRGEHILVPITGTLEQLDSIYTLNETASCVLTRTVEGAAPSAIAAELAAAFRVEPDQARNDVARALRDFVQLGVLIEKAA